MKVASFKTRAVRIAVQDSPTSGAGETADFVTLVLRSDEGVTGIGYTGFQSQLLTPALKATVDGLAEATVGSDPMDAEAMGARFRQIGGGSEAGLLTCALSAIDVALWDLKGKALEQPIYKLLGGYRDRVPTYRSGLLGRPSTLEELGRDARRLVAEGFRSMKFGLGAEPTLSGEIARVETMRSAVGPDIDLMIDVNQGWDVNRAIRIGRELARYDIYWLEDPTTYDDFGGAGADRPGPGYADRGGRVRLWDRTLPPADRATIRRHRDGGSAACRRHHAVDQGGAPGGGSQPAGGVASRPRGAGTRPGCGTEWTDPRVHSMVVPALPRGPRAGQWRGGAVRSAGARAGVR